MSSDALQRPFPPRYWWLKRLSAAGVVLALLLAGAWGAWAVHAERRLSGELDRLRAAGRPVTPSDLDPPPLPDEQNAAKLWIAAAGALDPNLESPRNSNLQYADHPPLPAEWWTLARGSYEQNRPALAAARRAAAMPEAVWVAQHASPLFNTGTPWLNGQRTLANTLADAALYAHHMGRDEEAIAYLRDICRQADAMENGGVFLIPHLVSCGIRAVAASTALQVAPGLSMTDEERWNSPAAATRPAGDARRTSDTTVLGLIADLLDESAQRRGLERAGECERVAIVDTYELVAAPFRLLRPLLTLDVATGVSESDRWLAATQHRHGRAAINAGRAVDRSFDQIAAVTRPVSATLRLRIGRAIETDQRVILERRFAAVSLAAQLYRRQHGRWPDKLEDLAPAYLPAVPRDPLSADENAPFGYLLAEGGTRPVIYSTGELEAMLPDFEASLPPEPVYRWRQTPRQVRNQFRDLSRFIPPPAATGPSTQP